MLVHELIALLIQEDPNKEVRVQVENHCGVGGCDCVDGTFEYEPLGVETEEHDFIVFY